MNSFIRRAAPNDLGALREIWSACFDDTPEEREAFFSRLFTAENALVFDDGAVSGAVYLCPLGDFVFSDGERTPCAATYALGVSPAHRSRGIGTALSLAAAELARSRGYLPVIVPAGTELFDFYGKLGYKTAFFAETLTVRAENACGTVLPLSAEEYLRRREAILADTPHIAFSREAADYQEYLCRSSGGGLFAVCLNGASAIAAVEGGSIPDAKEFLASDGACAPLAAALAFALGGELRLRTPAKDGARPFAMLLGTDFPPSWYGFAFD